MTGCVLYPEPLTESLVMLMFKKKKKIDERKRNQTSLMTKLRSVQALAVCIQGADGGFLDVFLTLVAFPTFRLSC